MGLEGKNYDKEEGKAFAKGRPLHYFQSVRNIRWLFLRNVNISVFHYTYCEPLICRI
jgi:hypothetical protein